MVSRYIVLFGITYLRLDIFITWWMSKSHSTVVLRHFAYLSVHHYILGHTPSPWITRPSTGFIHLFDLVVDLRELHTGAYPSSLGSSDLSQASLSFDLVVDPHKLSYWGISLPVGLACIIVWVILWLWVAWSGHSSSSSSSCHVISVSGTAPISIGHSSCQFESGPHLYRSTIFLSVQFDSGPYLYRSVICRVSLSRGHTYIDRPSSY